MSHFLISAAHKSSGKTILSIGICAEFKRRGLRVSPFKKGPDYIDPLWLTQAAGRSCHNLDFYTQNRDEILRCFHQNGQGTDICLIEGNKGLYDGMDVEGSNSNAALAFLLNAPVVLVLDTQGTTRGVAPLLLGYQTFAEGVEIAGVVLNKVAGMRHEGKLRAVIEHYTNLPILGSVYRSDALKIVERHLGLMPSNEAGESDQAIERIRSVVAEQLDVDALLSIGRRAVLPFHPEPSQAESGQVGAGLRIGVAQDDAFGFYYPGDLEAMQREGAVLEFFSPVRDQSLPKVDAIFIGGGFPEVRMEQLSSNVGMATSIRAFVEAGGALYAECGGLMYLSRSVTWNGKKCKMVGLVPGDAVMYQRPIGRGYVRLRKTAAFPWPDGDGDPGVIPAHEFHYSKLENLQAGLEYAYHMERGTGIDGSNDGFVYKNMLVNYTHLRSVEGYPWTQRFLQHVARTKRTAPL